MGNGQPPPRPLLARRIGPAFAVRVLDAKNDPYPAYFRHQSAAQAWGATNYPERFIVDRCDLATYDPDEQTPAAKPQATEVKIKFDLEGDDAIVIKPKLDAVKAAEAAKAARSDLGPVPCPSRRPDSHEQCRRPAGHADLHAVPGYEWTDEQAAAHDLAALERQRELGEAIEQGRRAMLDLLQGLVRDEMREGNHLFTQANTLKEQAEAAIERASVLRETLKKLGAK